MRSSRITVVRLNPLVNERFLTVENANVHVWDINEDQASSSASNFATESQGTMHIGVAPLQCADWSPHNQDVFVCGGRERVLTLYDMRQRRPEAWRASPAHDGTVRYLHRRNNCKKKKNRSLRHDFHHWLDIGLRRVAVTVSFDYGISDWQQLHSSISTLMQTELNRSLGHRYMQIFLQGWFAKKKKLVFLFDT